MYDSLLNFTVTKGKIEATDTLTELKNYVERYNSSELRKEIEASKDSLNNFYSEIEMSLEKLEDRSPLLEHKDVISELNKVKKELIRKI